LALKGCGIELARYNRRIKKAGHRIGPSPPKEDVRWITTSKNAPHKVCFETSDLGQTPYLHDPDFKDRSPSVGLSLFSTSVDAAPSPEELYPC
jgi:hypothetical protein